MAEPLITAEEVAERLAISRDEVYKLAREGRIPKVPIGRAVRFRPEAIEDWIRALEDGTLSAQQNGGAAL